MKNKKDSIAAFCGYTALVLLTFCILSLIFEWIIFGLISGLALAIISIVYIVITSIDKKPSTLSDFRKVDTIFVPDPELLKITFRRETGEPVPYWMENKHDDSYIQWIELLATKYLQLKNEPEEKENELSFGSISELKESDFEDL